MQQLSSSAAQVMNMLDVKRICSEVYYAVHVRSLKFCAVNTLPIYTYFGILMNIHKGCNSKNNFFTNM